MSVNKKTRGKIMVKKICVLQILSFYGIFLENKTTRLS